MARSTIFRKDALKKLQDPKQLDTAVKLTSPRGWMVLAVFGVIVFAVVVWSFVGSLPFRSNGIGILLYENSEIFDVSANGTGTVLELQAQLGATIAQGDRIAVIDLPDNVIRLAGARQQLQGLQNQYDIMRTNADSDIAERQANLEQQVASQRASIAAERVHLAFLLDLYADQEADLAKGYVTREQVDDTLTEIHTAEQTIRQANNQIATLQVEQVEFINTQRNNLLDLEQQVLEASNTLNELLVSTEQSREVVSPVDGTIVGIATKIGAQIADGDQIVVIEGKGGNLMMVGYFPIAQGKKLQPGMVAQVSPTTIERDIYGSINGQVTAVGEFPETEAGLLARLGNEALVDEMMASGPPIAVTISLDLDPNAISGLAWSSSYGPPVKVTSGTTASASVTAQNAVPIGLLLPIVQTWLDPEDPGTQ
jgi:HlyD family secretion protein